MQAAEPRELSVFQARDHAEHFDLLGRAKASLNEALPLVRKLSPGQRKAFLPLALVMPYLVALERTANTPFTAIADINPLYRFWRLATWRYG